MANFRGARNTKGSKNVYKNFNRMLIPMERNKKYLITEEVLASWYSSRIVEDQEFFTEFTTNRELMAFKLSEVYVHDKERNKILVGETYLAATRHGFVFISSASSGSMCVSALSSFTKLPLIFLNTISNENFTKPIITPPAIWFNMLMPYTLFPFNKLPWTNYS